MIRAVLDTNIIISSIFWKGKPYEVFRIGILGRYQILASSGILEEVMHKLRTKFHFPEEKILELKNILMAGCILIEAKSKFEAVRDKNDNKIIECAFDSKADYIVTGDLDLLVLKEFNGIKIVTAEKFLKELKKEL